MLPTNNPNVLSNTGMRYMVNRRERLPMQLGRDCRLAESESTADRRMQSKQKILQEFTEACQESDLYNLSIRALFEHVVPDGAEVLRYMEDENTWAEFASRYWEAGEIKTSDFSDFSNVVLSQQVKQAFMMPALIGGSLVTNMPTRLQTERIPGVSGIGDEAQEIPEGDPYPYATVGADYVDTPQTVKHGLLVGVTREAIFHDRTALVLNRASAVGQWLGIRKEKRILAVVLGINNVYKPKDSHLSTDTYQTGGATDAYDNTVTSNALVNYESVDNAREQFKRFRDPRTDEPIVLGPERRALIPDQLETQARLIATATQYRTAQGSTEMIHGNPASGFDYLTNEYVFDVGSSATTWFYGDFRGAFAYMENWPVTVVRAPRNNMREFENDIAFLYKASEKGTPAIIEPRKVVKNTE